MHSKLFGRRTAISCKIPVLGKHAEL
jgi:hypothetical protein